MILGLQQPVALDERRVAATGEHQPIVRTQQEGLGNTAKMTVSGDEGLLQCGLGRLRSSASAQMPAQ
jgi:hypothetical protein